jgi:hypothetical protein
VQRLGLKVPKTLSVMLVSASIASASACGGGGNTDGGPGDAEEPVTCVPTITLDAGSMCPVSPGGGGDCGPNCGPVVV